MTKNEYWKSSARNQREELNCTVKVMNGISVCCVSLANLPPGENAIVNLELQD